LAHDPLTKIGQPYAAEDGNLGNLFGVQILRGVAAILVLLHHQTQVIADRIPSALDLSILDNAAFGVDLFFPISGFVIYLSAVKLQEKSQTWQDFAWRRFVRVAPLYWAFTVLKLSIFFLAPSVFSHYHFTLWNAVASFLFLPAYNSYHAPEPVLSVGWTLAYEMLFYAIVTIALFARVRVLMFTAVAVTILATAGIFIPPGLGGLTYLADPIELEFLGGMAIAALHRRGWRLPVWASSCLLPIMFVLALGYPDGPHALEFKPIRAVFWGIPGIVIVAGVVGLESYIRRLPNRLALLIGDASYSLYLTHTFILPALGLVAFRFHLSGSPGAIAYILGSGGIALIVAVFFHRLVELPMLAVLNRRRTSWAV
jgi:exopolysaccharide production protein ExoZ